MTFGNLNDFVQPMIQQAKVLTVTLNPALDIWAEAERFCPEVKIRCEGARYEPGGGGVNVARVIKEFGGEVAAFVVTGGPTGRWLVEMLSKAGIEVIAEEFEGSTRPSLHVMERSSRQLYRFVLPGIELSDRDMATIEGALLSLISEAQPDYLVVSGSFPPGASPDFLPRIARKCKDLGVRLVADTSGAALVALVGAGAFLVKPDEEELVQLSSALGWQHDTVEARAQALVESGTAEVVVVTLGGEGGLLVSRDQQIRLPALPVTKVSAVGAGDSFVAGLVLALARNSSLDGAFRHGMAAGAAAVATPGSGLALRSDFERLLALAEADGKKPRG
ncbi:MAG: 1-phosphofructokinase family hexose kinase [Hyphomicrobiaceae bacterium]